MIRHALQDRKFPRHARLRILRRGQRMPAPGFREARDENVGSAIEVKQPHRQTRIGAHAGGNRQECIDAEIPVPDVDSERQRPVRARLEQARHQRQRQVVDHLVARILQHVNRRRPPGAGRPRHQDQFLRGRESGGTGVGCCHLVLGKHARQIGAKLRRQ